MLDLLRPNCLRTIKVSSVEGINQTVKQIFYYKGLKRNVSRNQNCLLRFSFLSLPHSSCLRATDTMDSAHLKLIPLLLPTSSHLRNFEKMFLGGFYRPVYGIIIHSWMLVGYHAMWLFLVHNMNTNKIKNNVTIWKIFFYDGIHAMSLFP